MLTSRKFLTQSQKTLTYLIFVKNSKSEFTLIIPTQKQEKVIILLRF